jgi:hypothetical protein
MSGDVTIVAGGATTIGANAITGPEIANDAVTLAKMANDSVGSAEIVNNTITSADILDGTVNSVDITDNAILNADINAAAAIAWSKMQALTSAYIVVGNASNVATAVNPGGDVEISNTGATTIQDNAVTLVKMADNSVGTAELVDLNVTTAKLADNAVTLVKMADNSVGTAELVNDAVTLAKMGDESVGSDEIINNSIASVDIGPDAVDTSEIAAGAVDTSELANGAVTLPKLAPGLRFTSGTIVVPPGGPVTVTTGLLAVTDCVLTVLDTAGVNWVAVSWAPGFAAGDIDIYAWILVVLGPPNILAAPGTPTLVSWLAIGN